LNENPNGLFIPTPKKTDFGLFISLKKNGAKHCYETLERNKNGQTNNIMLDLGPQLGNVVDIHATANISPDFEKISGFRKDQFEPGCELEQLTALIQIRY
jgi:hypothetical protein